MTTDLSGAAKKRRFHSIIIMAALGLSGGIATTLSLPSPVQAQFSESYNFLEAVKKRNGTDVTEAIDEPGSGAVIINTRDKSSGQTALHIVVEGRDAQWTGFLLQKGANPNIIDKNGNTPLLLATSLNFIGGIEYLIRFKADLDKQNRSGETALIRAVQLRKIPIVRLLVNAGADADITDNVAGLSARDYASRDARDAAILEIIESGAKTKPKATGGFDFSGVKEFGTN